MPQQEAELRTSIEHGGKAVNTAHGLNYSLAREIGGRFPAAVVEDEIEAERDAATGSRPGDADGDLDGGAEAGGGLGVDEPLDDGVARSHTRRG